MFEEILYGSGGGVATITLNRPEKLNALTFRTYEELAAALRLAEDDTAVGVVVITGAGRAFCAGGDFETSRTSLTTDAAVRTHFFDRMIDVSNAMLSLSTPVVCAVRGPCVGGGAELAMFADYIIADESAYFLFNGTALGGCSWWGTPQLLPYFVGVRRAEEILYFSRRVGAGEAARIGLVNRVATDGELVEATAKMCARILDLSEEGLRFTKAALRSVKSVLLSSMTASAEMNSASVGKPAYHAARAASFEGDAVSWRSRRPGIGTD